MRKAKTPKRGTPVLTLVSTETTTPQSVPQASHDTIQMLQKLLSEARRGRVVGLACVVLYDDNHYSPTVTGDVWRNPTFARGMVRSLDDLLADHVRGTAF